MMQFTAMNLRETLPEKISHIIKEAILNGELQPGDALPTEPELEKQFQVSRAVIRDAARMLKAQGLIEVRHGKGMFVSGSVVEALSDALLTSLRRNDASAWDVEQFELLLLPEVMVLAARQADEEDLKNLEAAAEHYLKQYWQLAEAEAAGKACGNYSELQSEAWRAFQAFMQAIFSAARNKLASLVGTIILQLRTWRTIVDKDTAASDLLASEQSYIMQCVESICSRDPRKIRAIFDTYPARNEAVMEILKRTPVGQSPQIPREYLLR